MTVKLSGVKYLVKGEYLGNTVEYISNAGDWILDDLENKIGGEFLSVCVAKMGYKLYPNIGKTDYMERLVKEREIREKTKITYSKL